MDRVQAYILNRNRENISYYKRLTNINRVFAKF